MRISPEYAAIMTERLVFQQKKLCEESIKLAELLYEKTPEYDKWIAEGRSILSSRSQKRIAKSNLTYDTIASNIDLASKVCGELLHSYNDFGIVPLCDHDTIHYINRIFINDMDYPLDCINTAFLNPDDFEVFFPQDIKTLKVDDIVFVREYLTHVLNMIKPSSTNHPTGNSESMNWIIFALIQRSAGNLGWKIKYENDDKLVNIYPTVRSNSSLIVTELIAGKTMLSTKDKEDIMRFMGKDNRNARFTINLLNEKHRKNGGASSRDLLFLYEREVKVAREFGVPCIYPELRMIAKSPLIRLYTDDLDYLDYYFSMIEPKMMESSKLSSIYEWEPSKSLVLNGIVLTDSGFNKNGLLQLFSTSDIKERYKGKFTISDNTKGIEIINDPNCEDGIFRFQCYLSYMMGGLLVTSNDEWWNEVP